MFCYCEQCEREAIACDIEYMYSTFACDMHLHNVECFFYNIYKQIIKTS